MPRGGRGTGGGGGGNDAHHRSGGGGGRGGGGRSRRSGGGGRGGNGSNGTHSRRRNDDSTGGSGGGAGGGSGGPRLSDEEVMIAFLPYMRSGNAKAAALHAQYGDDHRRFIAKAREFLLSDDKEDGVKNDGAHAQNGGGSKAGGSGGGVANERAAPAQAPPPPSQAPPPQAPPPQAPPVRAGGNTGSGGPLDVAMTYGPEGGRMLRQSQNTVQSETTGGPTAGLDRYNPAMARAALVGGAAAASGNAGGAGGGLVRPQPSSSAGPVRPQPQQQPLPGMGGMGGPTNMQQQPPMPGNVLGGGMGSSLGDPVLGGGIGGATIGGDAIGGPNTLGGGALPNAFGGLSLGGGDIGGGNANFGSNTLSGGGLSGFGGIPIGSGGTSGFSGGGLGSAGLGASSFGAGPGLGLGNGAGGLGGFNGNPLPMGGSAMLPPHLQQQQQQLPSAPNGLGAGATGRLNELGPAFASPPPPTRPMPSANPPGLDLQSQLPGGMPSSPVAASTATATAPAQDQRPPQSIPATPGAYQENESVPVTPAQNAEESKQKDEVQTPAPPTTPAKPVWQPRRTHTRLETQAGIVSCNGVQVTPSDPNRHLVIGPRTQIKATWSLPLSYLQERTIQRLKEEGLPPDKANALTIRDALAGLTVGLFRRGCSENGEHHSIVSKEIVPIPDDDGDDSRNHGPKDGYQFEVRHDLSPPSVVGTVPFYTPRTPGNVVLRLYFMNDAVVTLATGPLVKVETTNSRELDSTLRFILSNFKAKAGTANFTCLHNFATVLEQFRPDEGSSRGGGYGGRGPRDMYDGAGRAAFGCLAESRKVVDCAFGDYTKKKTKLANQENELQHIIDALPPPEVDENADRKEDEENDPDQKETVLPTELEIKTEEMKEVKKSQASNEKKWREIQLAYYSILKAAHHNSNSHLILRREVMSQVVLELDLFCPLCESFAPSPFGGKWGIGNCPRNITQHHFDSVTKARIHMQMEVLGFVSRRNSVSSILQGNHSEARSASKDPKTVLDQVSTSMIQLYDSKYRVTADVANLREQCRKTVEAVVASCTDVFPSGTRVVVFGSCANGFGSPSSDLDMCLQLPPNASLPAIGDDDENNGAAAMAKLAEKLVEVGLEDVDTVRLTARIPVLMFNYPIITPSGEKILLDCDLSMQNPLACLNTSLLLSYATISPQTRVLVSIIKRWAKTRDINSPQFHTLSSYGYILMLLHFLTHHTTTIHGNIVPYHEEDARRGGQYLTNQPLLPNLQRMQQEWPHSPRGTAYSEMREKPKHQSCSMPHPTESSFTVNTYFYRVADQVQKDNLKQRFAPTQSGVDPSVAFLLAEFFRYFAYNFDFKKHVVSLNSNYGAGLIEKEAKAESDGWSVYRQILAIEDPFENFYDVAHVLKPGTFQRVKREFAMAYSKLVDAMTGNRDAAWTGGAGKVNLQSMSGNEIVDWLCEPLPEDDVED